jgi:oligogalacturonide transport system substrate-binding protein
VASAVLAGLFTTTVSAADPVEIRMSWWGGDSRHKVTQDALKAFEAKYPGIKVKAEYTGWTGHLERITTQIAGGTEPDLMQINWPWLPLFSKRGDGFADLNEFKDVLDLKQFTPDVLKTATIKGKLNGLPVSITGRVYMFNPVAFKKAGLDVPKSWDDMLAAAPAFKKIGADYYPFDTTDLNPWYAAVHYVTQMTGKSFIDPDSNEIAWTKDEVAKGLQFYVELEDKGVIPNYEKSSAEGGTKLELHQKKAWIEGKLGGSYEWDSVWAKFRDPLGPQQDLVPVKTLMFKGAKSEGLLRKPTMMFSISKNSKNKKEAAMLLNFLMNDPAAVKILGDSRGIPASKVAADMLVKEGLVNKQVAFAHDVVMNGDAPQLSTFFEHPKMQELYRSTMEQLSYRKISVKDAAARLVDEGGDILAKATR